jgi:hypothetical protein
MSDLRKKITSRMDELEDLMNENTHISEPERVDEMISSVSKFWSVLSEEDRDYLQAARWAMEEKQIWKDDK